MKYLLPTAVIILALMFLPSISASLEDRCQDAYFLVVETNYNFTTKQLEDRNIDRRFISNYSEKCVASNYSDQLPKKPKDVVLIPNEDNEECKLDSPEIFESKMPFFKIDLGKIDCQTSKSLNNFFKVEESNNSFYIEETRTWWIFSLLILGLLLFIIKSTIITNKAAKRVAYG